MYNYAKTTTSHSCSSWPLLPQRVQCSLPSDGDRWAAPRSRGPLHGRHSHTRPGITAAVTAPNTVSELATPATSWHSSPPPSPNSSRSLPFLDRPGQIQTNLCQVCQAELVTTGQCNHLRTRFQTYSTLVLRMKQAETTLGGLRVVRRHSGQFML